MVTHLLPPFPVDGSHMRIEDISGRYIRNPLQKNPGMWQISRGFTYIHEISTNKRCFIKGMLQSMLLTFLFKIYKDKYISIDDNYPYSFKIDPSALYFPSTIYSNDCLLCP